MPSPVCWHVIRIPMNDIDVLNDPEFSSLPAFVLYNYEFHEKKICFLLFFGGENWFNPSVEIVIYKWHTEFNQQASILVFQQSHVILYQVNTKFGNISPWSFSISVCSIRTTHLVTRPESFIGPWLFFTPTIWHLKLIQYFFTSTGHSSVGGESG